MRNKINKKFQLGEVLITKQLHDFVMKNNVPILKYLRRHSVCDWGDVDDDEWLKNNDTVDSSQPIISIYKFNDTKIFIITEADRTATTMRLADDC